MMGVGAVNVLIAGRDIGPDRVNILQMGVHLTGAQMLQGAALKSPVGVMGLVNTLMKTGRYTAYRLKPGVSARIYTTAYS